MALIKRAKMGDRASMWRLSSDYDYGSGSSSHDLVADGSTTLFTSDCNAGSKTCDKVAAEVYYGIALVASFACDSAATSGTILYASRPRMCDTVDKAHVAASFRVSRFVIFEAYCRRQFPEGVARFVKIRFSSVAFSQFFG